MRLPSRVEREVLPLIAMRIEGRRGRKQSHAAGRDEVYVPSLVRDPYVQNVVFLRGCPYRIRMTTAQHGVWIIREVEEGHWVA